VTEEDQAGDPLRIPFVRAFLVGTMLAEMALKFVAVAIGWELYERTHDPWALGLVGLAYAVPAFALMLPAGALADRFPRRTIAMLAYSLSALATAGLVAASLLAAPLELIYGLLALSGAGQILGRPSIDSLLAQLLSPRQYARVYPFHVTLSELASIGGPVVGGALIALSGGAAASYLAAACAELAFVGLLSWLPARRSTPDLAPPRARDLLGGIAFIRRTPVFLAAITLDLFAVLLGGAVALLPIYARDILEIGPEGLGILAAAPSVGAAAAALLVTRRGPWQRPGRVLLLVVAGFGLATIGFGLSRNVWLSLLCLVLLGGFDSVSMVIRATLQQVITPDPLRGRVAAVDNLFTGTSNQLGSLESGGVAAMFGPLFAVVSGGIGTLVVIAAVAVLCPSLARLGPLHSLRPVRAETERRQ
jgi:MFS family permease